MTVNAPDRTSPRRPPQLLNQMMALILRSPFHRLISSSLLLLLFTGRKSGKIYTLPLGYLQKGESIMLFTDHTWWKNLRNNAPVTIWLNGKKRSGTAEAVLDDKEQTAQKLQDFVQRRPGAARAYGIKLDASGQPDLATIPQAVQRLTLIQVQLK